MKIGSIVKLVRPNKSIDIHKNNGAIVPNTLDYYTVREYIRKGEQNFDTDCIRLEEIVNEDKLYQYPKGNFFYCECGFMVEMFDEVLSLEKGIEVLEEFLEYELTN